VLSIWSVSQQSLEHRQHLQVVAKAAGYWVSQLSSWQWETM